MAFSLVLASLRRLLNYLKSHFKLAFRGVTSTLLSAAVVEGRERARNTLNIYDNVCCCCYCCSFEAKTLCVFKVHFLFNFVFCRRRKNVYRNIAVLLCLYLHHPRYSFLFSRFSLFATLKCDKKY